MLSFFIVHSYDNLFNLFFNLCTKKIMIQVRQRILFESYKFNTIFNQRKPKSLFTAQY